MEQIKVGSWTNHGKVLFIDNISELVPDPLCKMSETMVCSHRLSELILVDKPQSEIDKEIKLKQLMKEKHGLLKQLKAVEEQIEEL
jgi:hypothetical protein